MKSEKLVDTNLILLFVRDGDFFHRAADKYALFADPKSALISIVTEGEIRAIAERRSWGPSRMAKLEYVLRRFFRIPIVGDKFVTAYVEIANFCRVHPGGAHVMGQNDMWIAATARAIEANLLTTDSDFAPLFDAKMIGGGIVDPAPVN
ncbi:PIN domain-containing protein [bacterium]|nr:PIN domain-containing protein [bacterium]